MPVSSKTPNEVVSCSGSFHSPEGIKTLTGFLGRADTSRWREAHDGFSDSFPVIGRYWLTLGLSCMSSPVSTELQEKEAALENRKEVVKDHGSTRR